MTRFYRGACILKDSILAICTKTFQNYIDALNRFQNVIFLLIPFLFASERVFSLRTGHEWEPFAILRKRPDNHFFKYLLSSAYDGVL